MISEKIKKIMRYLNIFLLVLIMGVFSTSLMGCSAKKESVNEDDGETINFTVDMDYSFNSVNGGYTVDVTYKDGLFKNSAKKFNKQLALFAFGNAISNATDKTIAEFYKNAEFTDDVYLSTQYYETPTEDSVAYSFATKSTPEFKIVSVSVRGFNYKMEWVGNFNTGSTGNHENYSLKAEEIYSELKDYLSSLNGEKTKLLMTGYSRGGGIINALSELVLSDETFPINSDDVFVYTFEAPRAIEKNNVKKYKNVFNIVNSADIVTHLLPENFGFYRHGVDVEIFSDKVDELLSDLNENIVLPKFISNNENFKNQTDFPVYLFNTLTNYDADANYTLKSREDYAAHYQDAIKYFIKTANSLNSSSRSEIMGAFLENNLNFYMVLAAKDGLYEFLLPFLEKDGIAFDSEELRENCNTISNFIKHPALPLLLQIPLYKNDFVRCIYMHSPETIYVLLKNM